MLRNNIAMDIKLRAIEDSITQTELVGWRYAVINERYPFHFEKRICRAEERAR